MQAWVKCTKTCFGILKTIIFLVKCLKVLANHSLNWFVFHGNLYCRVEYSNIKYQDEIFKTHIFESDAHKQKVKYGFGRKFHDLK